jgi:hypothetical protein
MLICTSYDQALLEIVARRRKMGFEELLEEYCSTTNQHYNEESLSKLRIELKVLEEEQFIRISDENIIYIGS